MTPSRTIPVDPETADRIADQAAAAGQSIQEYLREHFSSAAAPSMIDPDRWLDELVAGLPDLPPLPPDFSTTDVYLDHD